MKGGRLRERERYPLNIEIITSKGTQIKGGRIRERERERE